jgi:hypothetical protein
MFRAGWFGARLGTAGKRKPSLCREGFVYNRAVKGYARSSRLRGVQRRRFPGALLYRTLFQASMHVPSKASVLRRASALRRISPVATFAGMGAAFLLSGCGNQYRPVVSAINPVGPAGQATKYAVAISSPTPTTAGLVTFVDFSGDTVITTPQIQTNPSYFVLNTSGTEGYTINAAGSFDFFGTSNPGSIITSDIGQTTLPVNSNPVTLTAITPASTTGTVFVPEVATSSVAALNSSTAALYDSVDVGPNPIYVVGYDGAARVYALSQGATPGTSTGTAAAIETAGSGSLSVSTTIPVGVNPTYGVMTTDDRRAFILNTGSGTVSVINVVSNALDTTTPTVTIPPISIGGGLTVPPNPVWAGLASTVNELVVLNQGDGIHPGTLTTISIPLCSLTSPVTNPNCNAANPSDAAGFGTIVSTVPVGVNPVMVSVLADGSTAYVANEGILPNTNSAYPNGIAGSLTAVNLSSGTVAATFPAIASPTSVTAATASDVYGHPNSISVTTGSPTGKVYVTSSDSHYMTIIYTDTNTVQNHIDLQGDGLRVIVTSP